MSHGILFLDKVYFFPLVTPTDIANCIINYVVTLESLTV